MPKLKIRDTNIHIQTFGQGHPVIMIHGLLIGNMASWYFGIASRLSQNFSVVLYDLRGHGLSDKIKTGYTLFDMVNDLEELLHNLNLNYVSLIGHSYGALIALHYALRHPQKIKQLIIIEAPLPPSKATQVELFLQKKPEDILESLPSNLQKMLLSQKRQAQKFLERIQFLVSGTDLVENLKNEHDIEDSLLKTLNVSTMLIYGLHGALNDVAQRLKEVLPQATLNYIDGGHYLPLEKPNELRHIMEQFIR